MASKAESAAVTEAPTGSPSHAYGATTGPPAPPPVYNPTAPPPTYEQTQDVNAPPPSYESLYGEFKTVDSPKGFLFFFRKAVGFFIGTLVAAILIGLVSLIPIAQIVIGSMNIHNCPVNRYIPIWLVVAGVFGLFKSITNFYYRAKSHNSGEERRPEDNVNQNPFDGIISCFLVAWFVAGTVWVCRHYRPTFDDPTSSFYCDKTTYMFAFVLIMIVYCMLLAFMFLTCCCGCCALCFGKRESNDGGGAA